MEEVDSWDFSNSKDSSVVGANGKAAGWGRAVWDSWEAGGMEPKLGGWVPLAQRQVTSSLVLGNEKPGGEEDGGKLRGFI